MIDLPPYFQQESMNPLISKRILTAALQKEFG
jgi:hypothetical protein